MALKGLPPLVLLCPGWGKSFALRFPPLGEQTALPPPGVYQRGNVRQSEETKGKDDEEKLEEITEREGFEPS